jgi:hypothetical protein
MRHLPHTMAVVLVLLLAAACNGETEVEPAPGEEEPGGVDPAEPGEGDDEAAPIADLEPGDCFVAAGGQVGTLAIAELTEVIVVDCAEEHEAEVFARAELPEDAEGQSPQLDAAGGAACLEDDRFSEYTGQPFEETDFQVTALRVTTDEGPQAEVVCAVYLPLTDEEVIEEGEDPLGAPGPTVAAPKEGSIRDGS